MKNMILLLTLVYIGLLLLDLSLRKKAKTTQSLKKFTVRTIRSIAFICAIGAGLWVAISIFGIISEPETLQNPNFLFVYIPFSTLWVSIMFFGMIAPFPGVWDTIVDNDDITVVKAFIFKRHWKVSEIRYCKLKRGGMNVYVENRKRKAFFIDGMSDHYTNFIKRMEKEEKKITYA